MNYSGNHHFNFNLSTVNCCSVACNLFEYSVVRTVLCTTQVIFCFTSQKRPPGSSPGYVVPGVVVVVVDVVLTLTRIIKSVVAGQAPVTLELRNTLGQNTNNSRWYTHSLYHSCSSCLHQKHIKVKSGVSLQCARSIPVHTSHCRISAVDVVSRRLRREECYKA